MSTTRCYLHLFALAAATMTCCAGIEHATTSRSVQLTCNEARSGPVTVHATTSQAGDLEALSITYLSRTVAIPPEALRDLRNIDIRRKGSFYGRAYRVDLQRPSIRFCLHSWDPNYLKKAYGKDIGVPVMVEFYIDDADSVTRFILPMSGPGIPVYDGILDRKEFTLHAR